MTVRGRGRVALLAVGHAVMRGSRGEESICRSHEEGAVGEFSTIHEIIDHRSLCLETSGGQLELFSCLLLHV
jgi:hypothetical protein